VAKLRRRGFVHVHLAGSEAKDDLPVHRGQKSCDSSTATEFADSVGWGYAVSEVEHFHCAVTAHFDIRKTTSAISGLLYRSCRVIA